MHYPLLYVLSFVSSLHTWGRILVCRAQRLKSDVFLYCSQRLFFKTRSLYHSGSLLPMMAAQWASKIFLSLLPVPFTGSHSYTQSFCGCPGDGLRSSFSQSKHFSDDWVFSLALHLQLWKLLFFCNYMNVTNDTLENQDLTALKLFRVTKMVRGGARIQNILGFFLFACFWERVSLYSPEWPGTCYVD